MRRTRQWWGERNRRRYIRMRSRSPNARVTRISVESAASDMVVCAWVISDEQDRAFH